MRRYAAILINARPFDSSIQLIVAIGLVVFITLAPAGCSSREIPESDRARGQIDELEGALALFRFDVGRYPTTEEGLKALVTDPGIDDWSGPYLDKPEIPKDPWGRSYGYRSPGGQRREFDLWSLGSDGKRGGSGEAADLESW